MTDYAQEQADELEALTSIFMDDLEGGRPDACLTFKRARQFGCQGWRALQVFLFGTALLRRGCGPRRQASHLTFLPCWLGMQR